MIFDFRNVLPKSRLARTVWAASLLLAVALLLLPFVFKLDGKVHADWQQFLGRFHPLAVHLPIGLILLVPVLEVTGIIRPSLREAAAFVLALCIPACLSAVLLGYLLAYGSGEIGATVTRHMWGGITLTIAVLLCALVRPAWSIGAVQGYARIGYPAMLTLVLLLLAWTAHQGGKPIERPAVLPGGRLNAIDLTTRTVLWSFSRPTAEANWSFGYVTAVDGGLWVDSYQALIKLQ